MRAMVLRAPRTPLGEELRPVPRPGRGELVLAVRACAVCRTDLHLVDGELPMARLPVVPGHEVVGTVLSAGEGVEGFAAGQRIGVPWLGATCGACRYCTEDRENLCDAPQFTGCTRDGGFATHIAVDARFALPLDSLAMDDVSVAPLLCAGLIGWRALRMAGDDARAIGLYGFGAAAHLIAQVARQQGRRVYAFTRVGDHEAQQHAIELGAAWAGDAQTAPPEALDAAIIFAPDGALVPIALGHVRKGGRVVCGGIHMSDIPSFAYARLWHERQIVSVANLQRRDGREFIAHVAAFGLRVDTMRYALERANDALDDLRAGRIRGAAVLVM